MTVDGFAVVEQRIREHQGEQFHTRSGLPFPAATRTMRCPICALPYSLDKMGFTQDHAPQKGGQSTFGAAHAVVLTCAGKDGCNNSAGTDYESAAAAIRNFGAILVERQHWSVNTDPGDRRHNVTRYIWIVGPYFDSGTSSRRRLFRPAEIASVVIGALGAL